MPEIQFSDSATLSGARITASARPARSPGQPNSALLAAQ